MKSITLMICIILMSFSATAEIIKLKDGTTVKGDITNKSPTDITITTSSGMLNIERSKMTDETIKRLSLSETSRDDLQKEVDFLRRRVKFLESQLAELNNQPMQTSPSNRGVQRNYSVSEEMKSKAFDLVNNAFKSQFAKTIPQVREIDYKVLNNVISFTWQEEMVVHRQTSEKHTVYTGKVAVGPDGSLMFLGIESKEAGGL